MEILHSRSFPRERTRISASFMSRAAFCNHFGSDKKKKKKKNSRAREDYSLYCDPEKYPNKRHDRIQESVLISVRFQDYTFMLARLKTGSGRRSEMNCFPHRYCATHANMLTRGNRKKNHARPHGRFNLFWGTGTCTGPTCMRGVREIVAEPRVVTQFPPADVQHSGAGGVLERAVQAARGVRRRRRRRLRQRAVSAPVRSGWIMMMALQNHRGCRCSLTRSHLLKGNICSR